MFILSLWEAFFSFYAWRAGAEHFAKIAHSGVASPSAPRISVFFSIVSCLPFSYEVTVGATSRLDTPLVRTRD
jgi:hypothetical protein